MGEAIGGVLPLAVGVALSPLPIIAVILMLVGQRARANGPMFVLGWIVGLLVVGVVVLGISGSAGANEDNAPATWIAPLKLVLGGLLIVLAARQWHSRPAPGDEPTTPEWMGALDSFTPMKAGGAGALLAGLNPKNLLLAIGAAATIAATGISAGNQAIAYGVFTLVATVSVALPVAIYFLLGHRAGVLLARVKTWMAYNNAAIMAVLCLVIGTKLIGDGIAGV